MRLIVIKYTGRTNRIAWEERKPGKFLCTKPHPFNLNTSNTIVPSLQLPLPPSTRTCICTAWRLSCSTSVSIGVLSPTGNRLTFVSYHRRRRRGSMAKTLCTLELIVIMPRPDVGMKLEQKTASEPNLTDQILSGKRSPSDPYPNFIGEAQVPRVSLVQAYIYILLPHFSTIMGIVQSMIIISLWPGVASPVFTPSSVFPRVRPRLQIKITSPDKQEGGYEDGRNWVHKSRGLALFRFSRTSMIMMLCWEV